MGSESSKFPRSPASPLASPDGGRRAEANAVPNPKVYTATSPHSE